MFVINVYKTHIHPEETEPLVSGSVNSYTCRFRFSQEWEQVDATAVFQAGENRISVPLPGKDTCVIPWEVLETAGQYLRLGVYGTRNSELVMPTIWQNLGIIHPGTELGQEASEPTQELYGQILQAASEAVQEVAALREELSSSAYTDLVPEHWVSHLDSRADEIRAAMEEAGRNKSAFFFYADAHWSSGARLSPRLLRYLHRRTPIHKTIFGGDIVGSEPTEETLEDRTIMAYLWQWRNMLQGLPGHHSVLGNHDDGADTNHLFSQNYVYSYLIAPEETPDMVPGGDFYYYIDDPCEKTRYLYLNTAAYSAVDTGQLAFVRDALLETPAGWHIVAAAHLWFEPDYDQYDARPVPVAGYGAGVQALLDLFDSYNARTGDFGSCGARVEFCIGGHVHWDYDGRTAGGIPIVLCETDSAHIRGQYAYTADTTDEAAVSAVIADYGANRIHIIRAGRGVSRTVQLALPSETYTNQIPLSVDMEGNVYNGTGVKDQVAVSSLDGVTELTDDVSENSWVSGLIPIQKGDVIRIQGYFDKQEYTDADIRYYQQLCFYNDNKSFNRSRYLSDFLDSSFLPGGFTWTGEAREGVLTFTFDGTSSLFSNAKYIRLAQCHIPDAAERLRSIATAVVTVNQAISG